MFYRKEKCFLAIVLVVGVFQGKLEAYRYPSIVTESAIVQLYPKTLEDIQERKEKAKIMFHGSLETFLKLSLEKESSRHILQTWDEMLANIEHQTEVFTLLSLVEPKDDLREANSSASQELKQELIKTLSDRKEIYAFFMALSKKEKIKQSLTEKERFYLAKLLKEMELEGLHLSDKERGRVKTLKIELAKLSEQFSSHIQEDKSSIKVTKEALKGLNDHFIEQLSVDQEHLYRLTCDYPTYFAVMKSCDNQETRRELYRAFMNRAYPKNIETLNQMIAKRDQLARLLGFKSFAHYQLSNEMVKDPKEAEVFLDKLLKSSASKQQAEVAEFKEALPMLTLTEKGKLYPWDMHYAQNKIKEINYQLDHELIKEYFPLETTVCGLIKIFESFFDMKMEKLPTSGLWHEDVQLLKVADRVSHKVYGYVLLDLFPRANKYSHACHGTVIAGLDLPDGSSTTSLSLVIANFSKPSSSKPSLMTLSEVKTFFHELGHGVHALMGRTQFAGTAGTRTMVDFVELPSQMLEEWLSEPEILAMVSSHYKTKEQLPAEIVGKIQKTKTMASGQFIGGQCLFSRFALDCFLTGESKDTDALMEKIHEEIDLCYAYDPHAHFQASFGHLDEYGARYYGYLWSRVLALDIFEQIKKEGLLNAKAGARYVKEILGKGGSEDPSEMIKAYLGREPSQEAFLRAYGVKN